MKDRLLAGAAAVDITPENGTQVAGNIGVKRPSDTVLDPLHCRALILQKGDTRLCYLSSDNLAIRCDYAAEVRRRAEERFGLSAGSVMVNCTQNHSAPSVGHCFCLDETFWREWVSDDLEWVLGGEPAYNELFIEKALSAIELALGRLQAVSVTAGRAIEGRAAFNRRAILRDGTAVMHPAIGDPNILQIEGPIDPEVGVALLRNDEGQDVCALLHFSCHPQQSVPQTAIASGWPGAWCEAMAEHLSVGAVPVAANGCCGNLHPRNPLDDKRLEYHEMGRMLAADAQKAIGMMPPPADREIALKAKSKTIQIPLRRLDPKLVNDARELLASHPEPMWLDDEKTRISWDWIYAISRLDLDRYCEAHSHFEYEIQAFRIGEIALLALTGEPFVEGQLRIKLGSPSPYTFVAHMSNGYVGYIPTSEAIQRGGYETDTSHWSKLAAQALDMIVEESVAVLGELYS
ncbi:MAG: hypothetical protein QGG53_02135 [Planctomycetota bacterium]|jgi:hypothetical protein|nr:hypothetical protein [Planctomycetota bacterium]